MRQILLLIIIILSIDLAAQTINKFPYVTRSMSDKIAVECLQGSGYALTIFLMANSNEMTNNAVAHGKYREILHSLHRHQKYSRNFIKELYRQWGWKALKDIGFTDTELLICRKIINSKTE